MAGGRGAAPPGPPPAPMLNPIYGCATARWLRAGGCGVHCTCCLVAEPWPVRHGSSIVGSGLARAPRTLARDTLAALGACLVPLLCAVLKAGRSQVHLNLWQAIQNPRPPTRMCVSVHAP